MKMRVCGYRHEPAQNAFLFRQQIYMLHKSITTIAPRRTKHRTIYMKKFSTIALVLAFAFPALGATQAFAQDAQARLAGSGKCSFLPDAPDKHVVVRGDTLWGISGKFLANPWCWPQVWGMNREEIRNPHWIYPGQIVYFDRVNGRLRLGQVIGGEPSGTTKLSPQL